VTSGSDALSGAYAKLDWATSHHDEMRRTFEAFVFEREGGTPYGIEFESRVYPPGLVIARFLVECEMPDAMSLLAGDIVHNTRVALDHTLARLKDHFGGDAGQGSFPICRDEPEWRARVVNRGVRSPLHGLEGTVAFDLIHAEQPLQRDAPAEDPLRILNKLDNADKHRLMHPAFVYPREGSGIDLIEVLAPDRIMQTTNLWQAGQRLENGTQLARFLIRGSPGDPPLRARNDAEIGYATGELEAGRTGYTDMIDRVREIVDNAVRVIDAARD
jgi:hypothetical protein